MKYLSVCSGIEAATVAWHQLGMTPVAFSEIDKFPSKVLAHHYPNVPNLGDMTKFKEWPDATDIDVLVGGTPCQSFSIAGLRKGLDDPRGNLMLTYLAIAERYRPRWLVWENVPGVLSSNGCRDFGTFLGALGELGYGFAYRVLDAQFFGVPQRRRRVFVVGCLGDWRRAAAVLFERESLLRNPAPSRKAQEDAAAGTLRSTGGGVCPPLRAGGNQTGGHRPPGTDVDTIDVATARNACSSPSGRLDFESETFVVHGTQDPCSGYVGFPLGRNSGRENAVLSGALSGVRRLTPRECERLQGFPDDYTNIPGAADGPRYKALGNSMAVPVMRWIGARIQMVDQITQEEQ